MNMDDEHSDLNAFFDAARRDSVVLPDGLRARILADAGREQGRGAPGATAGQTGFFERLREVLGGWAGIGGLAAACAAGVWMGFAPPASMPDPVAILMQNTETQVDLFASETLQMAMAEDF
ncbi:hypothetical protein [Heliomarina baculiformis]|uniref:hypothetical protein n=1 Tax=Heliomarina baculiformis TaxID=2872036 RepID=UPI001EE310EE|nr:hypothetical protein [Heliomarina baculiformis]